MAAPCVRDYPDATLILKGVVIVISGLAAVEHKHKLLWPSVVAALSRYPDVEVLIDSVAAHINEVTTINLCPAHVIAATHSGYDLFFHGYLLPWSMRRLAEAQWPDVVRLRRGFRLLSSILAGSRQARPEMPSSSSTRCTRNVDSDVKYSPQTEHLQ